MPAYGRPTGFDAFMAPGRPRARLLDVLAQERTPLEEAIASRKAAATDGLGVVISAHTTTMSWSWPSTSGVRPSVL